jgi:hypothetical protein
MNSPILQALGDTFTLMAGVMISPIPLAGLIVVLTSKGGRYKAIVFGAGFFVAVWLATFVVAWVGNEADAVSGGRGGSSMWRTIVHGGLGAFLLILGALSFIKWSRGPSKVKEPRWMRKLDAASMFTIFGIATLLVLVNPKNLALVVSAATDYAHADLSTAQLGVVVTVFATLGSLLAFVPIALELAAPETSTKVLDEMRPWLIANNGLILAVILVITGMHMLGKAVSA